MGNEFELKELYRYVTLCGEPVKGTCGGCLFQSLFIICMFIDEEKGFLSFFVYFKNL